MQDYNKFNTKVDIEKRAELIIKSEEANKLKPYEEQIYKRLSEETDEKIKKYVRRYIFTWIIFPYILFEIISIASPFGNSMVGGNIPGNNVMNANVMEQMGGDNINMAEAMAEFSKNPVFVGQEGSAKNIINSQMGIFGITEGINPQKPKPVVNPNVKEYIDEDGIKVRIEVKE